MARTKTRRPALDADNVARLMPTLSPEGIRNRVVGRMLDKAELRLKGAERWKIEPVGFRTEIDLLREVAADPTVTNQQLADFLVEQQARLESAGNKVLAHSDKLLHLNTRGLRSDKPLGELHVDPDVFPGAVFHIGTMCAGDGEPLPSSLYAHAHSGADAAEDGTYGLVCIKPRAWTGTSLVGNRVTDETPRGRLKKVQGYHGLVWHEYAHLVTGSGHTVAWRELMRSYGFPQDAERMRMRYAASRRMSA